MATEIEDDDWYPGKLHEQQSQLIEREEVKYKGSCKL